MPVPYCISCGQEMRCTKTGYILKPTDRADKAHYHTDLFECLHCRPHQKAHNNLAGPCFCSFGTAKG